MASSAPASSREPLYVDLDTTLLTADLTWESIGLLLRRHPRDFVSLLAWIARGPATLRARLADRVCPNARLLPFRRDVLARLRSERESGHSLVLVSSGHERVVRAVASELDLFDDVLATTDETALLGDRRRAALAAHSASRSFGYLGGARADLPIFADASPRIVVDPSARLRGSLERLEAPFEVLSTGQPRGWPGFLRALRPHQWTKNLLLFAPLVLAHELTDTLRLAAVTFGFLAFCAVASAGYILNDLVDIEADRRHPTKGMRPFASGTLSIPAGLLGAAALLVGGFAVAVGLVSLGFAFTLGIYLVATLAYSLDLKQRLFLDVLVLAGLYTLRVLAGGIAAGILVSTWLLAFSVFFFLSLALLKRYIELVERASGPQEALGHAAGTYRMVDTGLVETMGITSGYLSILVIGLYVNRDDATSLYATPELLWAAMPLLVYWLSRLWFIARRGEMPADPVRFAVADPISYGVLIALAAIGAAAVFVG